MPNQPHLLANASARVQGHGLLAAGDELSFSWITRYVHAFYVSWESAGDTDLKDLVPTQFLHSIAITYLVASEEVRMSHAIEVQNLTDDASYDYFGVQRPGRAVYYKFTAEL